MFRELDHDADAEEAFKSGAAAGDALAARNYGKALLDWERPAEAEMAFEVALHGGDELAAELLRDLRDRWSPESEAGRRSGAGAVRSSGV